MKASTRFRELLKQTGMLVAPGVYDAITARLAHQAGFAAAYMTGSGVAASLGYPDYGLITMSEMVERAGVIAGSVPIPLVSDADTGYGNELNMTRTVREFEARGVAAIHIEDQATPKRCGHLDGKELISREAYVSKIRAAVRARRDPDFTIIARTDARAVNGLDDAIERANAALEAGADMAFVEAPTSLEEVAAIPTRVNGPCMLNIVEGGKTPVFDLRVVQSLGYRLAIVPAATLFPMIWAADEALSALKSSQTVAPAPGGLDVRTLFRRFGAQEWDAIRSEVSE